MFLAFKLDRLRALQAPPRQAFQESYDYTSLREVEESCLQERNTLRQTGEGNEAVASKETEGSWRQEEEGYQEEASQEVNSNLGIFSKANVSTNPFCRSNLNDPSNKFNKKICLFQNKKTSTRFIAKCFQLIE